MTEPSTGRHAAGRDHDADPPTAPGSLPPTAPGSLPPDAAARDAARREEVGPVDDSIDRSEFNFVTRKVTAWEQAAVTAVLTQVRSEETDQVRRVDRREHQPWARSQRVPEGFGDLMMEP